MPNPLRAHLWQPLDVTKRQIRILVLYPSENIEDHPKGHLEIKSLDRHPVYDAISYAWGGPQRSPPLYLHGYRVPITENLHSCLRFLRHGRHPKNFWVDAICVDQNNSSERAQQVQQMEHVFRTADTVRAWLGDVEFEPMPRVFAIMAHIAAGALGGSLHDTKAGTGKVRPEDPADVRASIKNARFSKLVAVGPATETKHDPREIRPDVAEDTANVRYLTKSAWFNRLWVKQEAALARNLVFHYQHSEIPISVVLGFYDNLPRRGLSRFMAEVHAKREWYRTRNSIYEIKKLRGLLTDKGFTNAYSVTNLVTLMGRLRISEVHDVRDRIYGLSGIFSASFDNDLLKVDYNQSASEVFAMFAYNFIAMTKSLTLLSQADRDENAIASLPSWVPDWSSKYSFMSEISRLDRLSGAFYAAGRTSTAEPNSSEAGRLLGLKGCILGRVSSVGDVYEENHCPDIPLLVTEFSKISDCIIAWEKKARKEQGNYDDATFTRVLLRNKNGQNVSHGYTYPQIKDNAEAVSLLVDLKKDISRARLSNQVAWLTRSIARSRLFLFDDEKSVLAGLGAPDTQKGDIVAIMAGGEVPYILRKSSVPEKQGVYSFVSECYVQGFMYGEALERKNFPGFKDIWLE